VSPDVVYLSRFNTCCGVSTYTEQLAQAVSEQAVRVSALASDHGECVDGGECRDAIPSVPSMVSWHESDGGITALDDLLEASPRVIHIQHEFGIFKSTEGLLKLCQQIRRRLPQSKIVLTAHTVPASEPGSAFLKLLSVVDAVIVHSSIAKRSLLSFSEIGQKVHVIRHGMMEPGECLPRAEAESVLGIPHDPGRFTLLSLGFISRSKKHALLANMVAEAIKSRFVAPRNLTLIIAGMPTPDEGGARISSSLKMIIERNKLKGSIRYVEGFVPFDQLPAYYGAADMTVHMCSPSYHSSSGSVRMDLAYGMPVLVQKAELTQDLPSDTVCFFERDQELLHYLSLFAREPERLKRMRRGARVMTEMLSWKNTATKHKALYQELLGKPFGDKRGQVRAAVFHSCTSLLRG